MMKNFTILGLVLMSFVVKAQEVSVEKQLFGFQLGFVGSGFQYEIKLDRKITLMSEIGLTFASSTKTSNNPEIKDKTTTLFALI